MESPWIPLTIWTALAAYAAGEAGRVRPCGARSEGWARTIWSIGAALYLAHVVVAFDRAYAWSHGAAYAHTAARTRTLFGVDWGGGIWVNYLFTALWTAEAMWWWWSPEGYRGRARPVEYAVRATFLFMIVNGAVVFVSGASRYAGAAIVTVVCAIWFDAWWRRGTAPP